MKLGLLKFADGDLLYIYTLALLRIFFRSFRDHGFQGFPCKTYSRPSILWTTVRYQQMIYNC